MSAVNQMTGMHDVFTGTDDHTGRDYKLTVYAGGLHELATRPASDRSWSKGEFLGAAPLTPAAAEDGEADAAAGPTRPLMLTASGWVRVDLVPVNAPIRCPGWNDAHDCGRPDNHPGDHVCIGCHDQWNRGDWDNAVDGRDFVERHRDHEWPHADRCISEVTN